MEEKLRVRATCILPAALTLCTQMMEETNCSFWVEGQLVSGTQVAMSFSFAPQYLNSLQMNWAQVLLLWDIMTVLPQWIRSTEVGIHI